MSDQKIILGVCPVCGTACRVKTTILDCEFKDHFSSGGFSINLTDTKDPMNYLIVVHPTRQGSPCKGISCIPERLIF
ncbi:MAG: hypothetical protein NTX82_03345 [Candidatus Parcubacteria bacterium]|nr:hypothetical protein [Candidatus Parcubacteria bacterium]